MSAGVEGLLMRVAEVAGRKLTWWQYDLQTSWSAREWMPFALQRLSVQLWIALADEAQRAIGAASRGREGPRGDASAEPRVHSNSRPSSENRVKSQTAPTQTAHMNAKPDRTISAIQYYSSYEPINALNAHWRVQRP